MDTFLANKLNRASELHQLTKAKKPLLHFALLLRAQLR